MGLAMEKDDKYEIIAILREAIFRNSRLELKYNNESHITWVIKVDYTHFTIFCREARPPEKPFSFILHSDEGVISFSARYYKMLPAEKGIELVFFLPDIIFTVQRRQYQRFSVLSDHRFYCFGRYKNGENYALRIKNFSHGGCALIARSPNPRFLYRNALIKSARLDFGSLGDLPLDLKVVAVVPLEEFDENKQLYSCYQISCQFLFKSQREESAIDKLIIRFLISRKSGFYKSRKGIC
ncbi:flagellar brake protein [Intestinirhabdus alba]|jgi:c-di-GMP-binding flagellar brake protein YcgR|uniref:Pilus assembly protein PilZ n=1 Tax=Intestinirhabdus alba TaxID=2899544 RepID=A0A6L6IFZ0_9ENTR|nr:PilZ domain-containing protein [Intestinirhabdus alba]MTH44817.1 pilus assembly protein PilZ [Intestinirhabdus alba]